MNHNILSGKGAHGEIALCPRPGSKHAACRCPIPDCPSVKAPRAPTARGRFLFDFVVHLDLLKD